VEPDDEQLSELPDDVLRALELGRRTEAVALLQDATGVGLLTAKRQIDGYLDLHPQPVAVSDDEPVPYNTAQRLLLIAVVLLLGLLLIFL
jgi:hypothetical protein